MIEMLLELLAKDFRTEDAVNWADKSLSKILVLRMERRDNRYHVTYCIGQLNNGYLCEVKLPFESLSKRTWKTELIDYARAEKIYAKDLGVFSAISLLKVPIVGTEEGDAETTTETMEEGNA